MRDYRLYFLDAGGHVSRAIELDGPDDLGAMRAVQDHDAGEAMELWQRDRVVKTYPVAADRLSAPAPPRNPSDARR